MGATGELPQFTTLVQHQYCYVKNTDKSLFSAKIIVTFTLTYQWILEKILNVFQENDGYFPRK